MPGMNDIQRQMATEYYDKSDVIMQKFCYLANYVCVGAHS